MRSVVLLAALLIAGAAEARSKKPPEPVAPAPPPAPTGPSEADWRAPDPNNVLIIDTTKGRIIFEMTPEIAPKTVEQVRALTRTGLYDGRTFFRVIDHFMDQTGDPQDNGKGGSTMPDLPPEFTFRRGADTPFAMVGKSTVDEVGFIGATPVASQSLDLGLITVDHKVKAFTPFCPGVGGMARTEDPNTGNSQFYLMRDYSPGLDKQYTPFGRVIAGQDVVRAITIGEPPANPDKMTKVRVLADIPPAERPRIRVLDTRSAWFKYLYDKAAADQPGAFVLCTIDIPSEVK